MLVADKLLLRLRAVTPTQQKQDIAPLLCTSMAVRVYCCVMYVYIPGIIWVQQLLRVLLFTATPLRLCLALLQCIPPLPLIDVSSSPGYVTRTSILLTLILRI